MKKSSAQKTAKSAYTEGPAIAATSQVTISPARPLTTAAANSGALPPVC